MIIPLTLMIIVIVNSLVGFYILIYSSKKRKELFETNFLGVIELYVVYDKIAYTL